MGTSSSQDSTEPEQSESALTPPTPPTSQKLIVHIHEGAKFKEIDLEVSSNDQIRMLKEAIKSQEGISPYSQTLKHGGDELSGNRTVESYGLKGEAGVRQDIIECFVSPPKTTEININNEAKLEINGVKVKGRII